MDPNFCFMLKITDSILCHSFQLHQENRKEGKKREKSIDEEDEDAKREKLNKV